MYTFFSYKKQLYLMMDILIPLASIVAFNCKDNKHSGRDESDNKSCESNLAQNGKTKIQTQTQNAKGFEREDMK
jgi:hypothetical protein